jgi:hypothetical protein
MSDADSVAIPKGKNECFYFHSPLAHGLRLVNILAPHVDAMSTNKNGVRVGVLVHGLLEVLGEVLLVGCVLDDGDAQGVVVAEVPGPLEPAAETLDLLNVIDLEQAVLARGLPLQQQRHEHRPLRVRVDAAPCPALGEGGQEERRALRWLALRRRAYVCAVLEVRLLPLQG